MEVKHLTPVLARTPERGLWSVHEAIDRIFEDYLKGEVESVRYGYGAALSVPNVDVAETDREINVMVDLPGMDERDVEINLSKDRLVIKGEREEEREEKKLDFFRKERRAGRFYREVALPCDIVTEKATAEFEKGVLNIVLPKSSEVLRESRRIPIKSAA